MSGALQDDDGAFKPGVTVKEMVDFLASNGRAPGYDELQALVYRVVRNTCDHLHRERLGTLTIDRYIVREDTTEITYVENEE